MLLLFVVFWMWCTSGQHKPVANVGGQFSFHYPPFIGPRAKPEGCKFQFSQGHNNGAIPQVMSQLSDHGMDSELRR